MLEESEDSDHPTVSLSVTLCPNADAAAPVRGG